PPPPGKPPSPDGGGVSPPLGGRVSPPEGGGKSPPLGGSGTSPPLGGSGTSSPEGGGAVPSPEGGMGGAGGMGISSPGSMSSPDGRMGISSDGIGADSSSDGVPLWDSSLSSIHAPRKARVGAVLGPASAAVEPKPNTIKPAASSKRFMTYLVCKGGFVV